MRFFSLQEVGDTMVFLLLDTFLGAVLTMLVIGAVMFLYDPIGVATYVGHIFNAFAVAALGH